MTGAREREAAGPARIAFGLQATTIALKARTGQLREADKVTLLAAALDLFAEDAAVRRAVLDFVDRAPRDTAGAGAALQDFVLAWSGGAVQPRQTEAVLRDCVAHEWQTRKDCGLGLSLDE